MALSSCGGGGSQGNSSTSVPSPPSTEVLSDIELVEVSSHSAVLRFTTSLISEVSISLSPTEDPTIEAKLWTSPEGTEHTVQLDSLWADVQWRASVVHEGITKDIEFSTLAPNWPGNCREGDFKLPVMGNAQWTTYTDNNGSIETQADLGCNEQSAGVTLNFDLGNGEWVVASRATPFPSPIDLTSFSHLWIPIKGQARVPVALEIKLKDTSGNLSFVRLDGGSSVPVWRTWAVDLREFKPHFGTVDLSKISSIEIAFSWPLSFQGRRSGTVSVGDMWAWQINDKIIPVIEEEKVISNPNEMAAIAADLLTRQEEHGFMPAWYDLEPNMHLYANAMALIVLTLEYERLTSLSDSNDTYLQAANKMANALLEMQLMSDRDGAWDDSFDVVDNELVLKPESRRVMWVGSTAWAGIALILARDILPNGERFEQSIKNTVRFYEQSQECRGQAGFPAGSITEGTEGNLSSHLFLEAAVKRGFASRDSLDSLTSFIDEYLFDQKQRRFFCGVYVDIGDFNQTTCSMTGTGEIVSPNALACLDVTANWGSQWLKRQGRIADAYSGLAFGQAIFPTQGAANSDIKGLGDIAGPWFPTAEHGAGQWAAEGGPNANFIMNQASKHLCSEGKCKGASDDLLAGIGWNTTSYGIAPSAWMYIGWHGKFWEKL